MNGAGNGRTSPAQTDPSDGEPKATSLVGDAGYTLLVYGALQLLGGALMSRPLLAAGAQAVGAEFAIGRTLPVFADQPRGAHPIRRDDGPLQQTLIGAAIGTALCAFTAAFVVLSKGAALRPRSGEVASIASGASAIFLNLIASAMHATRDELVLHGTAWKAFAKIASPAVVIAFCGCASLAAELGEGAALGTAIVRGLVGAAFGALWLRARGARSAIAAHTAFRFCSELVLGGTIVEVRAAATPWGGGDAGALSGYAAVIATVVASAIAIRVAIVSRTTESL